VAALYRPPPEQAREDRPVRVILPSPREAGVDELYGMARERPPSRPWLGVCMIASLSWSAATGHV